MDTKVNVNSSDKSDFIARAKLEVDAIIRLNPETEVDKKRMQVLNMFIECIEVITTPSEMCKDLMVLLNKFIVDDIPVSPISLRPDEFNRHNIHKRFTALVLQGNDIMHHRAYRCKIINVYDHTTGNQIESSIIGTEVHQRVLRLMRGGIVTQQYIKEVFVRMDKVDIDRYIPRPAIVIPVNVIYVNEETIIYAADRNNPKVRALMDFYHVMGHENNDSLTKYDIRSYEKLKGKDK